MVLAGLATSVAATAARAASPTARRSTALLRYAGAVEALSAYVEREIAYWGLPGMTVALADGEGYTQVLTFGFSDIERSRPVTPSQLFQIGSISKSVAAVTLLTFVDEKRLDPEAPLAHYLPDLPLPAEPITVAQVLSHTAGLPGNAPVFPRVPDGRLWCGFTPGSSFSYSNTGYALLGHLIARLGGAPHPDVIRRRVLAPLGMTASLPAINDRDRARYANGYAPFSTTRPFLPRQPLIMGPWVDIDEASGGIASTPGDMARYLRFLIDAARGRPTAVLSPAAGRMLATSLADAPDFGPGARYGYGLATVPVGGRPCLHHTGGMLTFSSSLHADREAGVACFASVNAGLGNGYRPRLVTRYAIELMRALRDGKAVSPPDPSSGARIDKPNEMAGRYFGSDGRVIDLVVRGADMMLVSGGRSGRFVRSGEVLATDHPGYADAPFHADEKDGRTSVFWWRGRPFRRNAHEPAPATTDSLRALEGWYESSDPWVGGVILHAQGDHLVIDSADTLAIDSGSTLFEREGFYTLSETDTVERLRFEAPVAGRPSRLNFSGADMNNSTFAI